MKYETLDYFGASEAYSNLRRDPSFRRGETVIGVVMIVDGVHSGLRRTSVAPERWRQPVVPHVQPSTAPETVPSSGTPPKGFYVPTGQVTVGGDIMAQQAIFIRTEYGIRMLAIRTWRIPVPPSAGRWAIVPIANNLRSTYSLRSSEGQDTPLTPQQEVFNKIFENPSELANIDPSHLQIFLGSDTKNFRIGNLTQSQVTKGGLKINERHPIHPEEVTDRYVQWHPGTPRHFSGESYWKVSSGGTRTIWIDADGKMWRQPPRRANGVDMVGEPYQP